MEPTRTGLALSKPEVTRGHEVRERLSVTVTARYGGRASGAVSVKAGKAVICVIRLKSGKGTCTLRASQLKAGIYHLVATYHGAVDFARSASVRRTLTVRK